MGDLISSGDNGDNGDNGLIRIGEESGGETISFQLAQAFYNELTAKSERLTEKTHSSFVLTLSNVEQLHHRLVQSTEQYNIVSENSTYSIKYVDGSSERYSSIERFKLHAGHKGCAVDEINMTYNLMIVLPKTSRPQEYKININLISRVARVEGMRKDFDSTLFYVPLYQFEKIIKTGQITISFIDITVAHAILSTIKTWASGLQEITTPGVLRFLRSKSQFAPVILKYGFLALATYYSLQYSKEILTSEVSLRITADFILLSILISFISYRLGIFIGEFVEKNLDQVYELSYINFSPADERFVDKSRTKITRRIIYSSVSLISAFILGITCSWVAGKFLL